MKKTPNMLPSVRMGVIYGIYRHDLNKCYIGQSVAFSARVQNHRYKQERYVYQELWADGVDPEIVILCENVPEGELDDYESLAMETVVEEGWERINILGPNEHWPRVPREISVSVGKKSGPTNVLKAIEKKRAQWADPTERQRLLAISSASGKKGWETQRARIATDSEYARWHKSIQDKKAAHMRQRRYELYDSNPELRAEHARRGQIAGTLVKLENWKKDPSALEDFKTKMKPLSVKGGKTEGPRAARDIRRCDVCGLTTNRGALGKHQKFKGHAGFTQVSTYLTEGAPV